MTIQFLINIVTPCIEELVEQVVCLKRLRTAAVLSR